MGIDGLNIDYDTFSSESVPDMDSCRQSCISRSECHSIMYEKNKDICHLRRSSTNNVPLPYWPDYQYQHFFRTTKGNIDRREWTESG